MWCSRACIHEYCLWAWAHCAIFFTATLLACTCDFCKLMLHVKKSKHVFRAASGVLPKALHGTNVEVCTLCLYYCATILYLGSTCRCTPCITPFVVTVTLSSTILHWLLILSLAILMILHHIPNGKVGIHHMPLYGHQEKTSCDNEFRKKTSDFQMILCLTQTVLVWILFYKY